MNVKPNNAPTTHARTPSTDCKRCLLMSAGAGIGAKLPHCRCSFLTCGFDRRHGGYQVDGLMVLTTLAGLLIVVPRRVTSKRPVLLIAPRPVEHGRSQTHLPSLPTLLPSSHPSHPSHPPPRRCFRLMMTTEAIQPQRMVMVPACEASASVGMHDGVGRSRGPGVGGATGLRLVARRVS